MTTQEIRMNEKLKEVWDKSYISMDTNIYKTITQEEEYRKNMFQNDSSLTQLEKDFLLIELQKTCDSIRIVDNSEEKQQCNNCQNWHQATQYCEFCIRKYLKNNFENWTSGNNEIDKLIQECQQKTVSPDAIIEWISYNQLENIEYLTEGGCATVYTAIWKDGQNIKWNSDKQILERLGRQKIILKRLNNSNSNNVHWFQEITLSFTIDNTFMYLAKCYGLTKDPITQDYMLVLLYYDNDLRHFLIDNHHSLTWIQKYNIIHSIIFKLNEFHFKNIVHRDLNSGNILYNASSFDWKISDLGFSGPVDKPLNSIYGNLSYIAPEVLCDQIYTTKSDIYSIGILMWEIATGKTPFGDHEHDLDLSLAIVKGYRPKINDDIPHEYLTLMKQCWDANPDNRPNTLTIGNKMKLLIKSYYKEKDKQQKLTIKSKSLKSKIKNIFKSTLTKNKNDHEITNSQLIENTNTKNKINRIQTSKLHSYNIPIRPRNATDEEKYAFESKQNEFEISEELENMYLTNNQEYELADPSNSGSQFQK
ncbi:hypothetical protein Glove_22g76 [Diversispora epigaea]|uniref:Protein kinase domain-containing protein n=1 Tax=Diversispora epigaea TaxID=1348612 RepID=A0A397JJI7_9GLOM|nr:hypothetical protein Glove_22g76 [Diversispora epigaea]